KNTAERDLGVAAYGIVWKAIDRRTGEIVAVKKIFDAFRNRTDAQRTFREIMFLQEFGEHPNIIKLLNVIRAQNDRDIYLIFESMETDLHAVIKKGNLLKDIHKCYILYQLLKATKFIHSGNVIHRDQKPSNILLDADCFVKLCDFGLARSLYQIHEDQGSPALTEYVATRWYRAPEILLSSHSYTKGVDMWSIGCILGEMLLGKPLFPGTSTVNQIEQILSVIPAPSQEDILAIHSDYRASVINRISSRQRVTIEEILPSSTPAHALDLLKRLLVFNPDKRLTAEEALQHPYVKRFHCPAKEPSLDYSVILPLDDDIQLSVAEYRNKLYEVAPLILGRKGGDLRRIPFLVVRATVLCLSTVPTDKQGPAKSKGRRVEDYPHSPGLGLPTLVWDPPATSRNPSVEAATPPGSPLPEEGMPSPPQPGLASPDSVVAPWLNEEEGRCLEDVRRILLGSRKPSTRRTYLAPNPRNTQFPSRDAHPFLKSSKKMFQVTANMGAAGYPKASMGSYSQSYGTICKSALQNLPISNSLSGSPGPWPR
uniref:Mitogen-activated protein kinase 15 n=1 Tax=Chelonoidis abingdonii TaxID=106734 RepID=A0A8C0IY59_CHEAB